jgi:MarR family transcriptional regulator, transcriptional regulator for hemolysin
MSEQLNKEKFIFAALFDIANKLQILGDRKLRNTGITTRQWFLTVLVRQMEPIAPSIGECALQMGSSHQNIRQLTRRLENRGFITVKTDEMDRRTQRLYLTSQCREFWDHRTDQDVTFIHDLFSLFTLDEIDNLFNSLTKFRNLLSTEKK